MTPEPLVSVCIAVFNCERYIGRAIRSALNQTLEDFEVLVVDNASTDNTVGVVESIGNPRIRLVRNQTNIGPCLNWNRSIEDARGTFIKMLGADDILYPTCLERQIAAFRGPRGDSTALACFPRDIIDSSGRVRLRAHGWRVGLPRRVPGREAIRIMARRGRNMIGEPLTTFFRRRDAVDLGCFSPDIEQRLPFCLDWDLWCRLLQRGDLYICRDVLGAFRVNEGSNSLNLVDQFARNDREFVADLRRNGYAEISAWDCWLGAMHARKDALLRRAFYKYMELSRQRSGAGTHGQTDQA